jgi:catechol 2,3-dioxygenase-like lactoylglutathione lyase family enzyme
MPCAASLLAFLCGALTLSPVIAAPVPETERIPVDLRRTTLVVRDIDRSLPLYRDALGLKVIYDQVIGGTTRLVLLRANDDFVGVLGLMQRLNLTEPVPAPEFRKAQPGDPILVFNLQDLETRFERISGRTGRRGAAPHRVSGSRWQRHPGAVQRRLGRRRQFHRAQPDPGHTGGPVIRPGIRACRVRAAPWPRFSRAAG